MKIKEVLAKEGFRRLLIKIGLFVGIFIIISLVLGQLLVSMMLVSYKWMKK
jgi:hypothetical protein